MIIYAPRKYATVGNEPCIASVEEQPPRDRFDVLLLIHHQCKESTWQPKPRFSWANIKEKCGVCCKTLQPFPVAKRNKWKKQRCAKKPCPPSSFPSRILSPGLTWPSWQIFTGTMSETTGRGMQGWERAGNAGVRRDYKLDSERKHKRREKEKLSTEGLTAQANRRSCQYCSSLIN